MKVSTYPFDEEVQERWGHTDAYQESKQRQSHYTAEDIEMAKKQAAQAVDMFVVAMTAGLPATSPEAAQAAEAHRQAISDWWYNCSYDIQAGLAEMYLADSRFRQTYEDIHPGLSQFIHDAIMANAIANS